MTYRNMTTVMKIAFGTLAATLAIGLAGQVAQAGEKTRPRAKPGKCRALVKKTVKELAANSDKSGARVDEGVREVRASMCGRKEVPQAL